jgi:hypothetical protein
MLVGMPVVASSVSGQTTATVTDTTSRLERPDTPAPQVVPKEGATVPEWVAWRVFHDQVLTASGPARTALDQMLGTRVALTPQQQQAVRASSATYLATMEAIDREARATIAARYGQDLPTPSTDAPGTRAAGPVRRVVVVPAGKTLLEVVKESGLYAEVEQQHAAALTAHLADLRKTIGAEPLARLTQVIQTTVRPAIQRTNTRPPQPAPSGLSPAPTTGLAPEGSR